MGVVLTRRAMVGGVALALPFPTVAAANPAADVGMLEKANGGRLGVAALDTGSGRRIAWRADERFPMCSTFKLLLVALVLQRVDEGRETLVRRIAYDASLFPDRDFYAPITRTRLGGGGMSVAALCAAAISWSDNGAANLLLDTVGGPPAVTAFARSIGDPLTRLDRNEPTMNVFAPGDPRDTTAPSAMLADAHALLLTDRALSEASRKWITGWMLDCRTAGARIPAGLPKTWRSANKTGTYPSQGSANDVAIIWPPGRKPVVVAAYYTGSTAPAATRDAVLANVGRIVAATF